MKFDDTKKWYIHNPENDTQNSPWILRYKRIT